MKKTPRLKGRKIFQHSSDDLVIDVYESKHYRWMTFGNSNIQTAISLDAISAAILNYIPAMTLGSAFVTENSEILLLGLGGGGIVHHLRQKSPSMDLTAIEINAEVIEVAKQYFECHQDDKTHIIHQDARSFLSMSAQQYDCILCDIYSSKEYPRECFEDEFFRLSATHLTESGHFSINFIADDNSQSHRLIAMVKQAFNNQTIIIPIEGYSNIVIHAFKQRESLNTLIKTSNLFSRIIWDAEWGMIAEL